MTTLRTARRYAATARLCRSANATRDCGNVKPILTGSKSPDRLATSAASTHRRRSRDLLKGFGVTSENVLASEKERITRSKGGYDEITRPTESR